ncbi:hypothetical protein HBI81_178440 [Parastagonospora nodorum]|nr:hypothetical protein HBI95_160210 [Parastagonospora nodorum]KAH5186220.1 hypothetical protein HBH68_166190 [Parastagonospora nodorum]KAH5364146.1 hypothetical protein HBI33_187500 [Parastagonospora nodorum]KAH5407258.1 hypothetical protein HBI46_186780 [Parastagonospora nodorum]KAH6212512.1 hypothetical protein HBI15_141550 [Parastagonospora nodorum]
MEENTLSLRQPITNLLALPREIQDVIIAHLDLRQTSSERRFCCMPDRTLLDLSYTCKTLRTAGMPAIYKHINFIAWEMNVDHPFHRTAALLRTLSSSDHLRRCIQTLEIRRLDPADRTAERLLEHTPRLESLSYCYYIDFYHEGDPLPINTKRLSSALGHVQGTLRHLTIGYKARTKYHGLSNRPRPPILHSPCSFKHFALVEHLIIPLDVLLGWDVEQAPPLADALPPSLVSLNFERGAQHGFQDPTEHDPLYAVLKPFVEGGEWKSHTPRLKRVSGDIRVGDPVAGGYRELYRRSKAVEKLLNDNGLDYLEDVEQLMVDNFLLPQGEWGGGRKAFTERLTWENLGLEDLDLEE